MNATITDCRTARVSLEVKKLNRLKKKMKKKNLKKKKLNRISLEEKIDVRTNMVVDGFVSSKSVTPVPSPNMR